MTRRRLATVGKRELARGFEQKVTEAQGMMTLLTAIVAMHGGRLVIPIDRIEETPRMPVNTFISLEEGTVTVSAEWPEVGPDERGNLPPDPRSIRQRAANRLLL